MKATILLAEDERIACSECSTDYFTAKSGGDFTVVLRRTATRRCT